MSKYVSIDLETTGVDWETCQILSFGAVIEDRNNKVPVEDLPRFHKIIKRDFIQGEPYALNLNKDIIKTIKEGTHPDLVDENQLIVEFWNFLHLNGYDQRDEKDFLNGHVKVIGNTTIPTRSNSYSSIDINVAGKNFNSFDRRFLEKFPRFLDIFKIGRRVLDPASLYLNSEDEWLPNLQTCMDRAGVKSKVTHDACQDAMDVIKVLRFKGV